MKKIIRWVKLVVSGFNGSHCPLHAAGLTYFSMLALVPLLCVLLVFAKAVGADDFARRSVNEYLDSLIVNIERGQDDELFAKLPIEESDRERKRVAAGVFASEARNIANSLFERIEKFDIGTFGWIGFAFLLWTVVSSVGMVEVSFNEVWGVEKGRTPFKRALVHPSVALALPAAAALSVSPQMLNFARGVIETVFGAAWVTKWAGDWLVALIDWRFFRMVFSFIMSSLVFAVFFKVMPNREVRFRYALWGGVLSSLMFVSWLKACAVAQVGIAKSSALCGPFAFFPIVLAWMFISWEIVLLGASMVRAFECVCSENSAKL